MDFWGILLTRGVSVREFSYQREFRFLLRKKDAVDEYVTLEVGDLSDIAQSCKNG